jgi:hypothetical protein
MWLSAVAAAIALFAGVLWYHAANERNPVGDLHAGSIAAGTAPARPASPVAMSRARARPAGERYSALLVEPVPLGESPLSGARIDAVQTLFARLIATGFRGTVEIRSIPGRFCLQSVGDAVTLPAADLNYSKCDQLGNPIDVGSAAEGESVAFANMLSAQRSHSRGAFDVQLVSGSVDDVVTPYPMVSTQLTAGEWNRAAAANNRVEVRVHPLP